MSDIREIISTTIQEELLKRDFDVTGPRPPSRNMEVRSRNRLFHNPIVATLHLQIDGLVVDRFYSVRSRDTTIPYSDPDFIGTLLRALGR